MPRAKNWKQIQANKQNAQKSQKKDHQKESKNTQMISQNHYDAPKSKKMKLKQSIKQNETHIKKNPDKNMPSTSTNDTDVDLQIVQYNEIEQFYYKPGDHNWQQQVTQQLGIENCVENFHDTQPEITLGNPNTLVHILGDGNCFFRSISYYLFGTENQHELIRQLIISYMLTIPNEFESIVMPRYQNSLPKQKFSARKTKPVETLQGYINNSNMTRSGTWATECEILSTASLLNTNIYIYSCYGHQWKWLRYSPKDILPNANPHNKAIYLSHTNQNHFDCVIGVDKDKTQNNPTQKQQTLEKNKSNTKKQEFPEMIQKEFERQQKSTKTKLANKAKIKIEHTDKQKKQKKSEINTPNKKRKTNEVMNEKLTPNKSKVTQNNSTSNTEKNNRRYDGAELSDCIENFLKETSSGPIYVCTCCQQTFFKKSITEFTQSPKNEENPTFKLMNKCSTAFKSFENKEWICISCKTSIQTHNKIPTMSIANKMGFPIKPPQLFLHHTEERLIALRNPFMQIRQLPRGGQKSIHGNVVNIPCDIRPVANTLPRNMNDTDTISVKYKRKLSYDHSVMHENIRPKKVLEAIQYLMNNSELYKDAGVTINSKWESDINNDQNPETQAFLGKQNHKQKSKQK